MRTLLLGLTIAAAAAAVATESAAPAGLAKPAICGQIKHGPHATYTTLLTHKKISGSTWTVFATGVRCGPAMKAAPGALRWWAKAKINTIGATAGFACTKESDGHGSSGSEACTPLHGKPLANIELVMTGSMTIAQLRALVGG